MDEKEETGEERKRRQLGGAQLVELRMWAEQKVTLAGDEGQETR